jgi:hypothetical protein
MQTLASQLHKSLSAAASGGVGGGEAGAGVAPACGMAPPAGGVAGDATPACTTSSGSTRSDVQRLPAARSGPAGTVHQRPRRGQRPHRARCPGRRLRPDRPARLEIRSRSASTSRSASSCPAAPVGTPPIATPSSRQRAPPGPSLCRDGLPKTAHVAQGAGSHDIAWGSAGAARVNEIATPRACAVRSPDGPPGLPRSGRRLHLVPLLLLEVDYLLVGHAENLC